MGFLVLPVQGPQHALWPGTGDHDAARCGDHGAHLPHLEIPGPGRNAHTPVGAKPLWFGVLYLFAPAVLPRPATGPVRGRSHRRGEQLADFLEDRAPVDQTGRCCHAAIRVPSSVDRPDATSDLPARFEHVYGSARFEGTAGPIRIRRRMALGNRGHGKRDHDRPDDHLVLLRSAPFHRGNRDHRIKELKVICLIFLPISCGERLLRPTKLRAAWTAMAAENLFGMSSRASPAPSKVEAMAPSARTRIAAGAKTLRFLPNWA